MKGRITITLTIWCGTCSNWEYSDEVKKHKAGEKAKRQGWKYTHKYGWVCSVCYRAWLVGGPITREVF